MPPSTMALEALTSQLEDEIEDPEEETFLLFSRPAASHNLGFIDPAARTVDVSVAGRDFTIHQSPGVLSSTRAGGTTGAVLWKITPLFASYISSPSGHILPLLSSEDSPSVLELGCGISPLTALSLAPLVAHYILSDQPYVQRLVSLNIAENPPNPLPRRTKGKAADRRHQDSGSRSSSSSSSKVVFTPLDWETDSVTPSLSPTGHFDLVIACDCVYNDALVRPLVQTCADACRLKDELASRRGVEGDGQGQGATPCVCIVAQQLRSDDVFELWMTEFHRLFRVWRFPDLLLPEGLRPDDGFVIHAGVLRA